MYLLQSCFGRLIELEFEYVDIFIRLGNCVDISDVSAALRFNTKSNQPENNEENRLIIFFPANMYIVRNVCKKQLQLRARLKITWAFAGEYSGWIIMVRKRSIS